MGAGNQKNSPMRIFCCVNIALAIGLAAWLTSCHSDKHPKASSPVPTVDVLVVKARPVSNIVEVNGSVVANQ